MKYFVRIKLFCRNSQYKADFLALLSCSRKTDFTLFTTLFILGSLLIIPCHTTQAAGGLLESARGHLKTLGGDLGFDTRWNADAGVPYLVGNIIKTTLGMLGIVFLILTFYGG